MIIYKVVGLNGEIGAIAIMNVPLRTETGKDPELNDKPGKLKARKKFAITISTVSYLKYDVYFKTKKIKFCNNNEFLGPVAECSVITAFESFENLVPDLRLALAESKLANKKFGEKLSGFVFVQLHIQMIII